MENQAKLIEKLQQEKDEMIIENSWVYLTGEERNRYIELCKLQRKAIRKELTEKEFLNVVD